MAKNRIDVDYAMCHKMGLDDTFAFHCKACGKCCKHRTDVMLTPYDVFQIARYLGRTLDDIIERYCEVSAAYLSSPSAFWRVWMSPAAMGTARA